MRLSSRAKYGLIAMLCLARHERRGLLSVHDIAQHEQLPEHYLEQIITPLRKAALVESVRGAQGGYRLGRPASSISLLEIIESLDGPIDPAGSCAEDGSSCGAGTAFLDALVWLPLRDSVRDFLAQRNLKTVLEDGMAYSRSEKPLYYI